MTLEPDPGTPDLRSVLDDQLLLIPLNRPKAGNALNPAMLNALQREIIHAAHHADVRCVVVTGTGTALCSGGALRNTHIPPQSAAPLDASNAQLKDITRDQLGQ